MSSGKPTAESGKPKRKSKKGTRSITSPGMVRAQKFSQDVLAMRIAGASFYEIGKKLGCTRQGAAKACRRELDKIAALDEVAAKKLVDIETQRYERLQRAHWVKATQGDPASARVILKVMEQRERLLGLAAATRIELSGPDGAPIEIDYGRELEKRLESLGAPADENGMPVMRTPAHAAE